jgi:hypothetical protein
MNIRQINDFSISDFLQHEGIFPVRKAGRNWWYISPIRLQEKTPSFKVDISINRWYDHGTGEGGKLFDLAMRLFQATDVKAVIESLSTRDSRPHKYCVPGSLPAIDQNIKIVQVKPLTFHKALIHYLNSRGIHVETAAPYCKDVNFKIKNKEYFALGFENQSGGFELRNSFFKGSSSPKDLTLIQNRSDSVSVLEGFIDYLSLLTLKFMPADQDYLILNSLSFVSRSLPIVQNYKTINLFLDNDTSGKKATRSMLDAGLPANDQSHLYRDHKDINEFLTASMRLIERPHTGVRLK